MVSAFLVTSVLHPQPQTAPASVSGSSVETLAQYAVGIKLIEIGLVSILD